MSMSIIHPEHACARLIKADNPEASLATAKEWVRQCPADAQARIGLFQLLAVVGDWERRGSSCCWRQTWIRPGSAWLARMRASSTPNLSASRCWPVG